MAQPFSRLGRPGLGLEDSDAGQMAVFFGEIETVSDDELVGYIEADEIGLEIDGTAGLFIEENAGADRGRGTFQHLAAHGAKGVTGIENIVDQKDMAIRHIQTNRIDDFRLVDRSGGIPVAQGADTVEAEGKTDAPDQVGGEDEGAVDDGHDG